MTVTTEILRTYRDPRGVVARRLAAGRREDRAIMILMVAMLLFFVAQWPVVQRAVLEDATLLTPAAREDRFQGLIGARLVAVLFIGPLVFYALAFASHLVLRALGWQLTGYGARLALFWALLAVAPLVLLHGLATGFAVQPVALRALGLIVFAAFLWFWFSGLRAASGAPA